MDEKNKNSIDGYEQPEWVKIILALCREVGAYPIKRYEPRHAT